MPVTFRPVFQSKMEHCPENPREEHRCVGRFVVYAYLLASGEFAWSTPPSNPPIPPQRYRVSGKILPQKITIPFKVDFSDTITSADTVHKCMSPTGEPGAGDTFIEFGVMYGNLPVPVKIERVGIPQGTCNESGDCIDGKITFQWVAGVVNAVINATTNATTSPIPVIGGLSVGANASGAVTVGGITIPPLEVAYEVCYVDGCQKQTIPNDTATDAERIFGAPENLTVAPI